MVTPVKSVTGTVNSNALGSYVLTYRSTNGLGKVISIVRKVKVVDTTPPAFVPPPNVTVEFSNELGAKVFFAPKATDLCSTFVKVSSIPRSGTVFPIGTTTVRSRATDASGNSSFCNFQVTVLGAQGVKSNILSELLLARDSLTTPAVFNYLNGAISNLQQSLAPSLWIDQTHLNRASGSMDFDAEASAVGNLTKQMQHNQTSIPTTVFRAEVQRIVRADRLLAMIAFRDFATTRTSLDTLDDAKESLIRGDNSADSGQYLKAIKYYQKAWNFAINGH